MEPGDYRNVPRKVLTESMKWRYQMKPLLQTVFPRALPGPPEQPFLTIFHAGLTGGGAGGQRTNPGI